MKSSRALASVAAVFAAATVVVAAGCGGGGSDDVPPDAVAIVDGTPITKAELEQLMTRARKTITSSSQSFPKAGTQEYQAIQGQAVSLLVQREEIAREAEALGVEVTDKQIDAELERITKESFGGDPKKLTAQLEKQGYTQQAVRDELRTSLEAQGIQKQVVAAVKVTPEDAKKYYDDNPTKYSKPESRTVRHILVKTKPEADAIYQQLESGGNFAALAKQKSLDPGSKDVGGKLTITKGQTVAPFEKVAFALAVNAISKPVKTDYGYHVIQALTPVEPAKTTPYSAVAKQIQTDLLAQRRSEAPANWLKETEAKYKDKVDYAIGYEPPDTSTTTDTTSG